MTKQISRLQYTSWKEKSFSRHYGFFKVSLSNDVCSVVLGLLVWLDHPCTETNVLVLFHIQGQPTNKQPLQTQQFQSALRSNLFTFPSPDSFLCAFHFCQLQLSFFIQCGDQLLCTSHMHSCLSVKLHRCIHGFTDFLQQARKLLNPHHLSGLCIIGRKSSLSDLLLIVLHYPTLFRCSQLHFSQQSRQDTSFLYKLTK